MRISTHPGRRIISAPEVRAVMDHGTLHTQQQWADYFGVHLFTVKAWRQKGMILGNYSAPSEDRWDVVKGEAMKNIWRLYRMLERSSSSK